MEPGVTACTIVNFKPDARYEQGDFVAGENPPWVPLFQRGKLE